MCRRWREMNCLNEGEVGRGPGGSARAVHYTTFHFPEHLVNVVTSSECDEDTMCPEYKVVAVDVRPVAEEPSRTPALAGPAA